MIAGTTIGRKFSTFMSPMASPPKVHETSMQSHPAHKYGLKRKIDFTIVKDGDMIDIGDFHFRCVATPGHSPGHTSLYEANKKILVAGDHILFDITPNITYWVEMEDALRTVPG